MHPPLGDPIDRETPLQLVAIRLFAILLIAGGVGAIVMMVYRLLTGAIYIDFGFLGLVIGKGLLERKELWRKWAVFVAWLGIICTPLIAVLLVRGHVDWHWSLAGIHFDLWPSLPTMATLLTGLLVFCLWQQWVLTRTSVKKSFSSCGAKNNWWIPIAIASLVVCGMDAIQEAMTDQLFRSITPYEVTIEAFDAKTGRPLNPTIHPPSVSGKQIFPKMSYKAKGQRWNVSGIGSRPIEVGVSAEGYHEQKITMERAENARTLRVDLEKAANNDQP